MLVWASVSALSLFTREHTRAHTHTHRHKSSEQDPKTSTEQTLPDGTQTALRIEQTAAARDDKLET